MEEKTFSEATLHLMTASRISAQLEVSILTASEDAVQRPAQILMSSDTRVSILTASEDAVQLQGQNCMTANPPCFNPHCLRRCSATMLPRTGSVGIDIEFQSSLPPKMQCNLSLPTGSKRVNVSILTASEDAVQHCQYLIACMPFDCFNPHCLRRCSATGTRWISWLIY